MDSKLSIGFGDTHCNAVELFELTEEIFDEMVPLVNFMVDSKRTGSAQILRYDNHCTASGNLSNDLIAIRGLVCDQDAEFQAIDEKCDPDGIEHLPRQ